MSIETAVFLGAGASKTEGAPLQGELFRECFSSASGIESNDEMDRELAAFFSVMFKIDVNRADTWLFCPTCNELELTPKEKGVVTRLVSNHMQSRCPECQSVYSPLIVPPTFFKDLNNIFLLHGNVVRGVRR